MLFLLVRGSVFGSERGMERRGRKGGKGGRRGL